MNIVVLNVAVGEPPRWDTPPTYADMAYAWEQLEAARERAGADSVVSWARRSKDEWERFSDGREESWQSHSR